MPDRNRMRQLLLDISAVTGVRWLSTRGTTAAEAALANPQLGCVCLYGPEGTGKTTLMALTALRQPSWMMMDRLDSLEREGQEMLFHEFNRRGGKGLVVASRVPVAQLNLLPDLKSRLLTGIQVEMALPTDEELRQLLALWAEARQLTLPTAVMDYMLLRAERNPRVLAGLVAQLDRLSLEQKRAVTVPLAREILAG